MWSNQPTLASKIICVVFCAMLSRISLADEYYTLHAVHCMERFSAARIDVFGIYNIGEHIWPAAGNSTDRWKNHEDALRSLESELGVYMFGLSGRYSPDPIVCSGQYMTLTITAEERERQSGRDEDNRVKTRGPMKVDIQNGKGDVVYSETVYDGSLYAYGSRSGSIIIERCRPKSRRIHPFDDFEMACSAEQYRGP